MEKKNGIRTAAPAFAILPSVASYLALAQNMGETYHDV